MNIRIPLARPEITDSDRDAVLEVLRTPHLSMGPKLREFEQAICGYTGSKYAVAVNSGTSALQIAVRALGIERGAEVILPSFSFSALLNVVLQEELRPKFVDIDPETYNTTPELVAGAITPTTRLILAVHTFGISMDVEGVRLAVEDPRARLPRHTIHLIEDACEALGAEVRGRKTGSFGDVGLFAFYPNKQITTGEGGVLITNDKKLADRARQLRNQGRDAALDWYQHAEVGFSYRISDINCALGVSQLARIESVIARRQKLAEMYDHELARIEGIVRPALTNKVRRISWFVYPVRLRDEFTRRDRDWICQAMKRRGIATGRYFAPLHQQPVLKRYPSAKNAEDLKSRAAHPCSKDAQERSMYDLRHTEAVADRVIALPFFNELTEPQIQEVCASLDESMCELRRKM